MQAAYLPAGLALATLLCEVAELRYPVLDSVGLVPLALLYVLWAAAARRAANARTGWERQAWLWFTAAAALQALDVVALGALRLVDPGLALSLARREAAPVVAYPLLLVGLLMLSRRKSRASVVVCTLDAALVAGAVFFVLWSAVFRDLFAGSPLPFDERLEVMSYPAMGAAVAALAWLVLGRDARRLPAYALVVAAATLPLITDAYASTLELQGRAVGARIGDVGFVLASVLWATAARVAARSPAWTAGLMARGRAFEDALPLLTMALALGTAVQTVNEHGAISRLQFWMSAALIAGLLVRMALTLSENRRLWRDLSGESAFKTRLLRFISHEMANPLSPLRVQLKLLRAGRPTEEKSWAIVDRSVERLLSLSRDVREMALAETQRLVQHVEVVDAGAQVAAAAESAALLAKQKGLELVIHTALEPMPVRVDQQRFGQVLDNLLSNALKFTQAPGRITVRALRDGDKARVQVTDTGIGLSAEDRENLFQPFRRMQDAMAPGLGLGLYLCRAIMTELHGSIGVDSPGRGQGATFWVELPLDGTPAAAKVKVTGPRPPQVAGDAPVATVKLA